MKPQISEGFGSEWVLLNNHSEIVMQGKEGVAVILFPETDTPSFIAVKKLYEALPSDDPIKEKLYTLIYRIEMNQQDIMGANAWEK